MTRDFTHLQACIRRLETCSTAILKAYPTLDYGSHWMRFPCVWEESFPSRSAAAQNAEETFLSMYRQAAEWVRRYIDIDNLDGLFSTFRHSLNQRLGEVQDVLIPMRNQQSHRC